jgi:hypothetical protein
VVDSLKVLDPERPIREADIGQNAENDLPDPFRHFVTGNYRTAKLNHGSVVAQRAGCQCPHFAIN